VKREARADPRMYEDHPRYTTKVLAYMYGVSIKTMYTWRDEFNAGV